MKKCTLCGQNYPENSTKVKVPTFLDWAKYPIVSDEDLCPECSRKYATLHTTLKNEQ